MFRKIYIWYALGAMFTSIRSFPFSGAVRIMNDDDALDVDVDLYILTLATFCQ